MVNFRSLSSSLKGLARLWMFFPVFFLGVSFFLFDLKLNGLIRLLLSSGFWLVSFIAVIAGYGVLKLRWYSWYLFMFSNITIAYLTAVTLSHFSESDFKTYLFLTTIMIQLFFIYMVTKELRVPYFFPRIRWWESDPRYKLALPVELQRKDGTQSQAEIMDISKGGCFIKTHEKFNLEEKLNIEFKLFEKKINCYGLVVWSTESTITHPKGIGIKFTQVSRANLFYLKQATKKMKKITHDFRETIAGQTLNEYLQNGKS